MKKTVIFFSALFLGIILLIQCNQVVFEAATLTESGIELEVRLDLRSSPFDVQGNPMEGAYLDDEETRAQLGALEVDLPRAPTQEFTFQMTLFSYEFDQRGRNRILPDPHTNTVVVTRDGYVNAPDITFEESGVFVYEVTQVIGNVSGDWVLDEESQLLTIRVSRAYEDERLIVEVEEGAVFVNVFEYDVSDDIYEATVSRWENHVVQVCEAPDMTPILNAIERYGPSVSIYFENLATGCTFRHNSQRNFFAASTTKAPFALWLYNLADQGMIDLDETLTFRSEHLMMGAGVIRHEYGFGQEIPIRRLIALNIYQSDNVATQMLRHRFGYHGYANFIANLGGTRDFARDIWNSRLTADEAGFFMREIYRYIEGGHPNSEEFREHLLNNQLPQIVSDYPVASKSGQFRDFGGAWHDMAIVYAPSPYILVILSSRTGTEEDHRVFQYISHAFQEFNQLNFIEPWLD